MKIICLIENTQGHPLCACEHGLSVYIETGRHKILCDAGQSNAVFENAEKLGVDLTTVDSAFLSHGHYDHSGGLERFGEINPTARIYAQKGAVLPCRHGEKYIGISKAAANLGNLTLLDGSLKIDSELFVFSGITGRRFFPRGNFELQREINGVIMQDDFSHEQCLVISTENKKVLISGCAHNGIINILDRYYELFDSDPDIVISGFHMMKSTDYTAEDIEIIEKTAAELTKKDTVFYSGHCTGQAAFDIMKNIMGDKLIALHSGETITES